MTTACLLLVFAGFYAGYIASRKAAGTHDLPLRHFAAKEPQTVRIVGAFLLFLAAIAFVWNFGVLAGTLFFLVSLMVIGSLTIVLVPLRLLRFPYLIGLCLLALVAEICCI